MDRAIVNRNSPISLDDDDVDGYINEIPGVRSYGIRRHPPNGIETAPAKLQAFPQQQPLLKRRYREDGSTSIAKRLFQEVDPSNAVQLVRKDVQKNITQWNQKKSQFNSELLELEQKMVYEARGERDVKTVVTALLEQVSALKFELQDMAGLKIKFAAQTKSFEDLKVEKGEIEKEKLQMESRHRFELQDMAGLKIKFAAQTKSFEDLKVEKGEIEKEKLQMESRHRNEIDSVKAAVSDLKAGAAAESSKMAEKVAKLTAENVSVKAAVSELKAEAAAESSKMAAKVAKLTAENVDQLEEIKAARAARAEHSKFIERLMDSCSALNSEVEDLKLEKEETIMQHRKIIDVLNSSALKEREAMLEMWAAHVTKTKKDCKILDTALREKMGAVSQEREILKEELGAVSREREIFKEEVGAVSRERVTLQEELGAVSQERETLRKELEALRRDHRAVLREREKDKKELREREMDKTELKYMKRKYRVEQEDLKLFLKEMKETFEEKLLDYT